MLLSLPRFAVPALAFACQLISSSAFAAPIPEAALLDDLVAQAVFLKTPSGARLMAGVTLTDARYVTEASLQTFRQRLTWREMEELKDEIGTALARIREEFRALRSSQGKAPELGQGEALSGDDVRFLAQASERAFAGERIEGLVGKATEFMRVPHSAPPRDPAPTAAPSALESATVFEMREAAFSPLATADDIPMPNAGAIDLSAARVSFLGKATERAKAYTAFFKSLRLSEGDWRSVFGAAGKRFTLADWERIRKYNRILDGLNEYSKTRIEFQTFATHVRPEAYTALNEKTAEALAALGRRTLTVDEFLAIRKSAMDELKIDAIVLQVERRMIESVARLKELGGGHLGNSNARSSIDISEDNILKYQAERARLGAAIRARKAEAARGGASPARLRELKLANLKDQGDLDLALLRERREIEQLKTMYLDFVRNYDILEMFVNLRVGAMNGEKVQAFDIADALMPMRDELAAWGAYYERALHNSTHELVLGELRVFYSTRLGATRSFVQQMNKLTGKYFGRKFTDGPMGNQFLAYSRSIATESILRTLKFVGLPGAAALSAKWGPEIANRLWNSIFLEAPPAEEARPSDAPPTAPYGTPASGSVAPASGSPAPASPGSPASDPLPPLPIDDVFAPSNP